MVGIYSVICRYGLTLYLILSDFITSVAPFDLELNPGKITLLRTKRGIKYIECKNKYKVIQNHTACLIPSPDASNPGITVEEMKIIIDEHNRIRSQVTPTATDMMKLSWDDAIANLAQKWAENCEIKHDAYYQRRDFGRLTVGQNIAWGNWKMDWKFAIKIWYDEIAEFTYGSSANKLGRVGHFTQLVWAKSVKVGCGYVFCGKWHVYVCNYGPAGNSGLSNPYTSGPTCQDCPKSCKDGLCDCNGKVCLNDAKMNPDTCECTCIAKLPMYQLPDCALNCSLLSDRWWCPQFGNVSCSSYVNVPSECPGMCSWCPAAGIQYTGDKAQGTANITATASPNKAPPTTAAQMKPIATDNDVKKLDEKLDKMSTSIRDELKEQIADIKKMLSNQVEEEMSLLEDENAGLYDIVNELEKKLNEQEEQVLEALKQANDAEQKAIKTETLVNDRQYGATDFRPMANSIGQIAGLLDKVKISLNEATKVKTLK